MRKELEEYFKNNYSNFIIINDFENKNYGFDSIVSDRNINILIEYKDRYFESGKTERYLKEYDILIELIQGLYRINKIPYDVKNGSINRYASAHSINIDIGWFYKCIADRLVFCRFLDDDIYDIIDLDFKFFKQWMMNEISNYQLQFSDKSSGTINLKVPLKDIPRIFYKYISKKAHEER